MTPSSTSVPEPGHGAHLIHTTTLEVLCRG